MGILGKTIRQIREEKQIPANKLANEYDIGNGILSRIENTVTDFKFIPLWRIAESLNIKFSDLAKFIENN